VHFSLKYGKEKIQDSLLNGMVSYVNFLEELLISRSLVFFLNQINVFLVENFENNETDLPDYVKNKKSRAKVENKLKQFYWSNEKYIKGFVSFLVLMIMVS
jgi:hypothetical protein